MYANIRTRFFIYFFIVFRCLTTAEILDELERMDAMEDSDTSDEEGGPISNVSETTIYIMPPNDGFVTDEDSGDETTVTPDNLTGPQLSAEAHTSSTVDEPDEPVSSKKKIKIRQWKSEDLAIKNIDVCYPYKPSAADKPRSPCEIFELYLDTVAIDLLTKQTVSYAVQKGAHTFSLSSSDMKAFLAILIISGYSTVPRRRMYWENESDVRNELIATSMKRDRFDEIFRYFHAADNNNLDSTDKYAKVRPLLSLLNNRFMKFGSVFGPTNVSIDESMVPYYGRYPSKQFIRGEPIRWVYKAWVAADPLGYT